jgi:hypothetical protein
MPLLWPCFQAVPLGAEIARSDLTEALDAPTFQAIEAAYNSTPSWSSVTST